MIVHSAMLFASLGIGSVGQAPKHPVQVSAPVPADTVASVAFSPNGDLLAAGGFRVVRIFDSKSGRVLLTLPGHPGTVSALAFSPDGRTLAAAGGEPGRKGEVRLWDVSFVKPQGLWAVKQAPRILDGPNDAIYAIAFSGDGRRLAAASYDHDVTIWGFPTTQSKIQNPKLVLSGANGSKILKDHTDAVYGLAFSPDGSLLATAAGDRTVKVWDPASGKRLYTLSEATAEVYTVAFSPDGRQLAAGGADKAVRTYNVTRAVGTLAKTAFAHEGAVLHVAYLDRSTLVSSGEDMLVKEWDAASLQEKRVLPKQPDWPSALAIRPGPGLIAIGTHNGALSIYDAAGKLVKRLQPGHAIGAVTNEIMPSSSSIPGRRLGDQKQRRAPGTGGATLFQASLGAVSPAGVVRGTTTRIMLTGGLINNASGVHFDDPAITGKIVSPPDPNAGILRVDAALAPQTRVGIHRCWVQTPLGTTGSATFAVGAWPEAAQSEPNNTVESAQKIALPCTVVGALDHPGDVDTYRFDVRAGEEVVFEVVAQPIRSRIDPVLVVMDESGATLAESKRQIGRPDTSLGYRFEEAGSYCVQIRDFEGAGGGDVHYRMNVGELPLVTGVFPLGIQKGTTREFTVEGFNLPAAHKISVTAPTETTWGRMMEIPLPGGLGVSRRIAVGEDPEVISDGANRSTESAQLISVPTAISARLTDSKLNTQNSILAHYYRFHARKGEQLVVDIQARRLGSPLDSEIEILDAKGARIERAVLRVVSQTDITFSDRDSASTGIRLTAWDTLHMKDFVQIGREVMSVDRLPKGPDEDVFFRSFRGQRLGYLGTTPEFHTIGAQVYKVEVHPPGSKFSPNGYPVTRLYYQNDDGGPLYGKDSHIDFTAPEDGDFLIRVSDTRGMQGHDFVYRLLVHPPRPDYRLSMSPEHPNIPVGGRALVSVECERYDGFDGPIEVSMTGLPSGVTATNTIIEAGENSASMLLTAAPDAKTPTTYAEPVRLVGKAKIDGREVARSIEPDNGARLVTILPAPDIRVATDRTDIVIRPGQTTVVEAQVERLGKFGARVPIDVKNLPYGVWVQNVGLNGVLITEQQDAREFSLYCEPWVKPQTRPFYVIGNVEGGTANAAPVLTLKVESAPGPRSGLQSSKAVSKVSRR